MIPKEIPISPWNLWSNPISPSGILSFTIMSSLSPLNSRNSELGGFSINYVHVTSEPTDNQVSSFSPVRTISSSSCPVHHLWMTKFRAWWLLNRFRHCDLWTDRLLSLIFQSSKDYFFVVMSSSPPLNGRVMSLANPNRYVHIISEPGGT